MTVLKRRGRYVAMTGDGVNDILPVRTADVGVAMQSGSPATRGVADLVLVRDDFSILPEAIRDGQRIVAAMAATLTVLLARTFYVLLIIVGAALLELPFPFTPRQNSILAFITVGVRSSSSRCGSSRDRHARASWARRCGSRSRCRSAWRRSRCRSMPPRSSTERRPTSPGPC